MPDWVLLAMIGAAFPVLWIGVLFVGAAVGPWRSLATQYPVDREFSGTRFMFLSLGSGLSSSSHCICDVVNDDHLTLPIGFLFRPFHPPFTIPRSAICDVVPGRFLFIHHVEFCVSGKKLKLYGSVTTSPFWESN